MSAPNLAATQPCAAPPTQPSVGDTSFDELAETIFELEPRCGYEERAALVRDRAALMVDSLLVRVVRGQGAVDLAIGRDLHALSKGKKLNRLGYVRLGDYARERLGIPEGTAREMVRLAKGLESLPALRSAVWSGEVEASKALTVLPVVTQDSEERWLEAARTKSVRELRREVREARDARGACPQDDEALRPSERVSVIMKKKERAVLLEALDVAREIEGATAPMWVLVEALAAEFIGSFASVLAVADQEAAAKVSGPKTVGWENGTQMSGGGAGRTQMSGNGAGSTQMSGNDHDAQMSGGGAGRTQMSGNGAGSTQMSGNDHDAQMSGGGAGSTQMSGNDHNAQMSGGGAGDAEKFGNDAQMSGNDHNAQMSGGGAGDAEKFGNDVQMSGNDHDAQMSGNDHDAQMSGNDHDAPMSGISSSVRSIRRRETRLLVQPLPPAWIDECCEHLEEWTDAWSFLEQGIPHVPGLDVHPELCPFTLDERLRKLARMRDGWGELTGRLALIIKVYGLWRDMQFVSFAHYCNERLASSARTIEQRAFLERRFFELPGLREALRKREINYSKALVLASTATAVSINERIEWARTYTCKEMRNAIEDKREAEDEKALGDLMDGQSLVYVDIDAPSHTVDLLRDAVFAAEAIWKAAGLGWMRSGDALACISEHFIEIWSGRTGAPTGKRKEILGRHRGQCCVPTCTLPAEEQHHIVFRSRGGGDEKENQVGICVTHHDDLHDGYLRILGRAGSRVVYELGLRNGVASEAHVRA